MITYQIFENTIIILNNGKPYFIQKDDPRYQTVLDNINDLKEEHFLPTKYLPKGFHYKEDALFYYKFKIPTKVEKIILQQKDKESFVNFWANLVNRYSIEEIFSFFKLIEEKKLYPITNDGFVVFAPDNFKLVDPFIMTNYPVESLEKHLKYPLEFWKKTEFTNSIKSLIKGRVKLSYLRGISCLIKNQSLDQALSLIKNPPLYDHQEIVGPSFVRLVNLFLKNESNTFSKERFDNLINHDLFFDLKAKYTFVSTEKIKIDLHNMSVEAAYNLINREYKRVKKEGKNLNIEENFPNVKSLKGLDVSEFKIEVPLTTRDLIAWGSNLGNCVGNGTYGKRCIEESIYILGLSYQNEIVASIEVENHKVVQFEWKKKNFYKKTAENLIVSIINEKIKESLSND